MSPVTKTPFTWENVKCPVTILSVALLAALAVVGGFLAGVI